MMQDNYLKCLSRNMGKMVSLQYQMATGKRLNKMSDDPVDAMSVMQFRAKLYRSERYKESVESGLTWLQQTESSVLELNEILKSAYETVIQISNDWLGDDDKKAAAELIGQLRDHVLTIGNTQSGTQHIFAGTTPKKRLTVDAAETAV